MQIMDHSGRRFDHVSIDDLRSIMTPPATRTWEPVSHKWLVDTMLAEVRNRGFQLRGEPDLRVSGSTGKEQRGSEMFGIFDIGLPGNDAWGLSVGLRNTHNKRASAAILLGTRVWLCTNLSFSADYSLTRKHYRDSYDALRVGVSEIMGKLAVYAQERETTIDRLRNAVIDAKTCSLAVVQLAKANAIGAKDIVPIIDEFNAPSDDNPESNRRTAWGLLNATTYVCRPYFKLNPRTASERSLAIESTIRQAAGIA